VCRNGNDVGLNEKKWGRGAKNFKQKSLQKIENLKFLMDHEEGGVLKFKWRKKWDGGGGCAFADASAIFGSHVLHPSLAQIMTPHQLYFFRGGGKKWQGLYKCRPINNALL